MNTAISEYEIFVEEIKELIHKKQYHTLRMLNSETINLYWEIGKEICRQQEEKGWGKSIVQVNCKNNFLVRQGIRPQICGECVIFI